MIDEEKIEAIRLNFAKFPDLIAYSEQWRRKYDADDLEHIKNILPIYGLREFNIPEDSFTHVLEFDTRLQIAKALNYLVQTGGATRYDKCLVYADPMALSNKKNRYVAEIIKPLPSGGYFYTQAKEVNAAFWGVHNTYQECRWFIDKNANMYYINLSELVNIRGVLPDSPVPGNLHYYTRYIIPEQAGVFTQFNYEYFNIDSTTRVRMDRLMMSTWDNTYKKDDLIRHLNRNPHDNRLCNLVISARIRGGEEYDEERYYNKHKTGPIKKHGRAINMYDKQGNVISMFLSIQECCDSTGASRDKIRYALKTGKDIAGMRFGYASSDPLGVYTEDGKIQPYRVEDSNGNVIFRKASAISIAKMLNVPYYTITNSMYRGTPINTGDNKFYVRKDT